MGRPGSGAVPPPTAHPLGVAAGAHYPPAVAAGGAGVGTCHQTHSARSRELALRPGGAARERPGGRLLPGCGASRVGRSLSPDHSSFRAGGRGPQPTGCGCRGCGSGDPSPTPQRALLRAALRAVGAACGCPGGGRLLPGCEASGVGRSPASDHSSFGRAAGAHYPLAGSKILNNRLQLATMCHILPQFGLVRSNGSPTMLKPLLCTPTGYISVTIERRCGAGFQPATHVHG